jgi:hypothetical protein
MCNFILEMISDLEVNFIELILSAFRVVDISSYSETRFGIEERVVVVYSATRVNFEFKKEIRLVNNPKFESKRKFQKCLTLNL